MGAKSRPAPLPVPHAILSPVGAVAPPLPFINDGGVAGSFKVAGSGVGCP